MKLPEPTSAALNVAPPDGAIASAVRALAAGARLDEFEIGEIIGQGSTTIVYAATEPAGAVPVAIAEYMPARLARRHEAQVAPRTSAQADAFAKGLKAFIHETRTLARCNHPSLLRIVRLLEANGTAYRVMPRYPATRLLDVRGGMNEPPDEQAVRALLDALLGALGIFHQAGGGHGKVTPSNILLLADNRPLLLGPGAAGRAIAGDRIDALMTSVEPCFAPIEQMVESADTPLRPSVDLYALAAVARYWISGELPAPAFGTPESPRREKLADTVQRLRLTWPRLNYSATLLDALDNALSIYPAERPQNVAQMRARLGPAPVVAAAPARAASTAALARDDAARSSPLPAVSPQPALDDTLPASPGSAPRPAPASQPEASDGVSPSPVSQPAPPDRATQDFDVLMSSAPDSDPLATSGLDRIDDGRPGRATFARQARRPRRIARWTGAVFALVALALVGAFEFGQEDQVARMLGALGIGLGTSGSDIAAVTAPAAGTAAPAPPMTEDTASDKPMPTEPAAADSAASATAAASSENAALAADAGAAKPVPTQPTGADSPAGVSAPASPAASGSATPAPAAPVASPAPPIIAAPAPASVTPAPTRSAQQRASRGPTSPREVCGPRTQFSLYRCMKVQCSQRRWTSHAQCQRLRKTDSVD